MESIVILVGAISGSVVSIIYSVFSSVRKSRCVECKCCGMSCTRDVMNEKEMKIDYNMGMDSESGYQNGRTMPKTAPFIQTPFSREVGINKEKVLLSGFLSKKEIEIENNGENIITNAI